MITISHHSTCLEIRPVTPDTLQAVLEVYRGCEDFLALGPVATASMEMVLSDLELSKSIGATFCGIHIPDGTMIGVLDYVPSGYQGNPQAAYLSLLMIAAPWRSQGIGDAVVAAVEAEIKKDASVTVILAGVQVNNPKAIRFWQRHGYRISSEPKLYPDGTTAVDLQKDI
jgi:ribosomal protein S18 acetylase RimI-like enzyme